MSRAAGGSTPRGKKDEPEEPPEQLGKIEFSLDYQFDKNQLTINIVQCTELKAMDISGTSDPYVKVFILPEKKKKFATKVHKKTLNPVFNENFTFPKLPFTEVPSKTLILQIFDHDAVGADDQIGEVQVPLGSVDLAEITKFNREIKEPPKDVLGDICFSLRYVPQKKQLTMNIMECKNLKKMDLGGLSDPYVKINLMQNNKRVKKSKTSIKMHTLNPYYNESFKFEVAPEMIQRTQVVVMVMDYDRVGSNEPIGQVILGLGSGGTAQKHWCDMIAAPRRSIAQWHSLVPVEDKKDD